MIINSYFGLNLFLNFDGSFIYKIENNYNYKNNNNNNNNNN